MRRDLPGLSVCDGAGGGFYAAVKEPAGKVEGGEGSIFKPSFDGPAFRPSWGELSGKATGVVACVLQVPIGEETDIICAEYDNLVSKGQFVTMDRFSGDHTVNMTGNALIQNDGKAISKGYAVAQRARVTSNVGAAWGYGGGGGFQELFGTAG
ncbi:hypothetical protein CHLRE_13g563450v5 [Chlamydomonas reinhardtii]|uniref:Uncharacterized protein n=1 Tax=Chlamydomonas reinhardtii TaxID=3055 RepID=A0A2K3CZ30_CHLRE|nr:uncharacterized protein CHLRE_13g563450v5 [Chlamydomonas reinhardtii]PNW73545.1 hypothetical protein CHLRE_13g563450v5 [Chlamydomonas reinhardtii]